MWTCPNKKLIPTEYHNKVVFGPKEVNSAATDGTQMAIFRQEELNAGATMIQSLLKYLIFVEQVAHTLTVMLMTKFISEEWK